MAANICKGLQTNRVQGIKIDVANKENDGLPPGLPESYVHVTTPTERDAHRRMYHAWCKNPIGVQLQSSKVADGDGADVLLYLVFRDVEGSLAVIAAALASCGVNVKRAAAFTTSKGPAAIDTFQLDSFDSEAEAYLTEQLTAHLGEIEG